ncbi:carbohydrate ABC transporter permease [Cohnella silvisoli]|uniref:Carbohydrate ABC transporter permease n=1 Tax=Cohnella silvisoli TaxID=2873699 RepID=A0ABV1KZH7_9BACL|nr:carbohydrate ABC transporter permease [Cohnella silvisoli]MCD9024794.1 carbohydrate ABC transporter permease [Cohnella silvisoli]
MKKSLGEKIADVLIYAVLIIILIVTLYPFYNSLVLSFNNGHDSNLGGVYFYPRMFTLENYRRAMDNNLMGGAMTVTVARTLIGAATSVLFTAAVAYGLSKQDLMFRRTYIVIGIITMYFSGGIIPFYFVLKYLGLLDTFMVFIIPSLLSFWNVILFMSFFRTIPAPLLESARIDGAHEVFIFARIVLPLSVPIIATIALMNGIGQWSSWFDSQFFTTNPHLKTLQLILYEIIALAAGQERLKQQLGITNDTASYTIESVRYATMMISIGPVILIYPFIQKYFAKGMLIGAVKG